MRVVTAPSTARPLPSLAVVGAGCVGGYNGSRVRVCTVSSAGRDSLQFVVVVAAAVRCGDGGREWDEGRCRGDRVLRRFTDYYVAFDCRWVLRFDVLVRNALASRASLAPADMALLRTRDALPLVRAA